MRKEKPLLSKLTRAQREDMSLSKHPLVDEDLEVKLRYISALSLVVCIDEQVHWREKQYLLMMMHAFSIPREDFDALLIQGKDWDETMIKECVDFIRDHGLTNVFCYDCALASAFDGMVKYQEDQLITTLSNWLHLSRQDKELTEVILQVTSTNAPIDFYHTHKDMFTGSDHVRAIFAMLCHDLERRQKSRNKR